MIQFGWFVLMLKLDLFDYCIVQDIYFSFGGVFGGIGKVGEVDLIEIYVYFEMFESDEIV